MVRFYRTFVPLSKAMYIYDTIIQCAFIVLCIAVYSCLTRGSQDTLHNHLNPDQDKVITEDN